MAMTAKLFSISALSTELARDRRTVAKALSHTRPDGKTAGGDDAWFLVTALSALDRSEDRRSHRHGGDNRDIDEVEFTSQKVHELLERLRSEPSIERRRQMIEDGQGSVVGEFARAVERAQSQSNETMRTISAPYADRMVGGAIGELFRLCDWKLDVSK
jgi:hypothetical protein